MKKWEYFHKICGIIFILIGIITYLTPVPGSTLLIILGCIWLIGKKRTSYFLKEVLGKKIFNFLKIKILVKKL
ncbi:MAG: hypothetical protein WC671_02360 [Candidatus Paceibacterota bacterium]|jgi:hypothetical protein